MTRSSCTLHVDPTCMKAMDLSQCINAYIVVSPCCEGTTSMQFFRKYRSKALFLPI